jgi:polyhydroxyalkanoate synthesis regulator phasin
MNRFDNLVRRAFYMGVGIASYAQERAGDTLVEIKSQAQKLADEMIARGEINVDEARKFVDDMVRQAQQDIVQPSESKTEEKKEPRVIEIISEEEPETKKPDRRVEDLRQQVASLQEELRRLQRE